MTDKEHKRLIDYARYTVVNGAIPENVIPISSGYSSLPTDFYRHSIYKLWLKTTCKRNTWIEFLYSVFMDRFKGVEVKTTYKKFSSYTDNGDYDGDKSKIEF